MELFTLLQTSPLVLAAVTFVFSLLVGSFLNVIILRFPERLKYQWTRDCKEHLGEKFEGTAPPGIIWERSRCPQCGYQIKAWHNIPLLGQLLLKGQCANCGTKISHRYWFVELLTAILSTLVVLKFGWSAQTVAALILTWWLIVIAFIDIDTMLIPDQLSLPLIWLGLIVNLKGLFVPPEQAILGAVLGYLILWSIFHLFRLLTGKEGMGYGDFKLLAAAGAWLGPKALLLVLVLSSIAGAVIGIAQLLLSRHKKSQPFPFGPYLAIGTWIALMYGDTLIDWYLHSAGL